MSATRPAQPGPDQSGPDPAEAAFIWRVLEQFAFDACDELLWRVEDGRMRIYVNCSDVFDWACADAEEVTAQNLPLLVAARQDAEAVVGRFAHEWPMLFCARVRGQRPQGALYRHIRPELHALFDACGPARETGFGNPVGR